MKRLLWSSALVLLLSLAVLTSILVGVAPHASQAREASTSVCGSIYTNTTWTLINSPYDVCAGGVTVGPTATLMIQPGVAVQFQQGVNAKLYVQGTLTAIGTVTQPVTFTGVVTTPGSWGGISADYAVITPALVNLSYVTLDGGGIGSASAQIYADRAVVTITHSLVRNGGSDGLHFTYREAGFNIQTTSFISNNLAAIRLDTPATDILLSDLSASSNGTNGVYLYAQGMNVNGQRRWTNPGIPYVINYLPTNHLGDELTIDPGSELQFMSNSGLGVGGQLKAIGLPDQPITFTAQTPAPGGWRGIVIDGGTQNAVAQLDYATVEYGGGDIGGANIVVQNGQLIARHSIVRYSAKDGLQFGTKGSGSILNSQIISSSLIVTTTHGIYNGTPTNAVLATNDWWGDPNGPKSDIGCGSGQGDKVTSGVLFQPVLTNTNLTAEFPLSDAPQLTLTPRRWFAPADGVSKIYFDLTLRDGNGTPIVGQQIRLHTTRGNVTDGGFTDPGGHALGYIVASNGDVGDANVSATVDGATGCVGVMSPVSKVTFTAPLNVTDLFPDSPAPYFADNISLTPLPVITGISETIHAKLVNPLTVPITVDVSFAFVQSSIGLTFGPIKDIVDQVIPPSGTVNLSADFMPYVSGHYCVQITYAITAIGSAHLLRPQAGSQLKQFNANPYQGPTMPQSSKDSLNKADKSIKKVKKLAPTGTNIQMGIFDRWWGWVKDTTEKIDKSLGGDPPRQDYNVATVPIWYRWPHTSPDATISITRANALNAASDALADVNAYGTAAATALDRYGGASQAKDLTWAAQQANAQIHYEQQMGTALLTYADALDNFVQVLKDENETNITVTVGDVISYQQSISATGFTSQQIADAKLVGLTDADIEAFRQELIAADPNDLAGNILDMYSNEAFVSRNLGNALLHPYSFAPGFSVSGGVGLMQATAVTTATGNTLAQINNIVTTIPLSNSLAQTSTLVSVVARRIDLPADWAVTVSPAQVTLGPGQQTTVTVSILTGSPAPQGSVPRVAVEGYANSQLLGGVVVDVIVPNYVPFAPYHVYLPLIKKN